MLLLLSVFVIGLIVYYIFKNIEDIKEYIRYRTLLAKLPTYKDWQFILGHAWYLAGVSSDELWTIIRNHLKDCAPVTTLYLGPALVFVTIKDPDDVETIISSTKNLEKAQVYGFLHDWLEDGLLTSKGSQWQTRRKILTPAFHFSILQGFVEIFTRETSNMVKEIEEKYLDREVDTVPIMSNYTLLTINETSMGTKLNTNTKEGLSYKNAIYDMGDILMYRFLSPWLHYKRMFDISPIGKTNKKLIQIMRGFTENIIRQRAMTFKVFEEPLDEDKETIGFKRQKHPLLDIMLNAKFKDNSINEKGIREEVNTFMFEGHDTTAMSLSFTCMLLANNKEIQNEIYNEIVQILGTDSNKEPTYADLQNMTFLERCIKESLRLYPSVSFIGRTLDTDVPTKCGIVPKGATCFLQIYEVHRNPKHWPDPEKFDPSRYLPENSRGRHPFAYIPFSAGPRNCIGQRFAMFEMKAAICGIIRKFVLEPVDTSDSIVMVQDMILRTKYGVKVKFVLRN